MLPIFKILAFFWGQFYSIASKKKLLLTYPSFFPTQEQKSRKKGKRMSYEKFKTAFRETQIYWNLPKLTPKKCLIGNGRKK